jgi:hypothetical protein
VRGGRSLHLGEKRRPQKPAHHFQDEAASVFSWGRFFLGASGRGIAFALTGGYSPFRRSRFRTPSNFAPVSLGRGFFVVRGPASRWPFSFIGERLVPRALKPEGRRPPAYGPLGSAFAPERRFVNASLGQTNALNAAPTKANAIPNKRGATRGFALSVVACRCLRRRLRIESKADELQCQNCQSNSHHRISYFRIGFGGKAKSC